MSNTETHNNDERREHGKRGLSRLMAAFTNSISGIKYIWKNEEAFRIEIVSIFVLFAIIPFLDTTPMENGLLIAALLFVLVVEVLNTAIEVTIDRIGVEWNELSGKAKDLGSLAVLASLAIATVIWVSILI